MSLSLYDCELWDVVPGPRCAPRRADASRHALAVANALTPATRDAPPIVGNDARELRSRERVFDGPDGETRILHFDYNASRRAAQTNPSTLVFAGSV